MKSCKVCQIEKSLDHFYKNGGGRKGFQTTCKECQKKIQSDRRKEYRSNFSGKVAFSKKCNRCNSVRKSEEFYLNKSTSSGLGAYCKSCHKEIAKISVKNRDPEVIKLQSRRNHIKRAYGLSMDDFDAMLESQRGLCAICECILDKPFIDHDHVTGVVRDLLCATCNSGIGMFNDDPDLMGKAIQYINRHSNTRQVR